VDGSFFVTARLSHGFPVLPFGQVVSFQPALGWVRALRGRIIICTIIGRSCSTHLAKAYLFLI
jgi:hypothetical protein